MHDAHAGELGVLHAGDGAEDASFGVVLPELHDRVGLLAGARVRKADGLHRAEPQRLGAATCDHLDRQAALEVHVLLEVLYGGELRSHERLDEGVILLLGHREVQVVCLTLTVTGGEIDFLLVQRLAEDDGGCRIVEKQGLAGESGDLLRQRVRGQGAGGDDRGARVYLCGLLANHPYVRVAVHRLRNGQREVLPRETQRATRWDHIRVGTVNDYRLQAPELLLQEPRCRLQRKVAHRVRADQLGQGVGAVGWRLLDRPHFPQLDRAAPLGRLPGSLATREATADNRYIHHSVIILRRKAAQLGTYFMLSTLESSRVPGEVEGVSGHP